MIAAAEGAKSGGGVGRADAPVGQRSECLAPAVEAVLVGTGTGAAEPGRAASVPLQEEEVIQAIRLLTRFGEVGGDPNADTTSICRKN